MPIDFTETFTTISDAPPSENEFFPPSLKSSVLNLASANLICSVALTGVMALQAARWWAESSDPEQETEDLQEEDTSNQQQQKNGGKKRRKANHHHHQKEALRKREK